MSFPNQETVIIHKTEQPLFLMVGREDVLTISKALEEPCAIALYLYLACNKDGYHFDLSQVAYSNATGFSRSSYYRAKKKLKECGYLYEDSCGRLNFATSPKSGLRTQCQNWEEDDSDQTQISINSDTDQSQIGDKSVSEVNREIKKEKDNKKNIKERKTNSQKKDYSYLDAIVNYEDGSFMWDGSIRYIDGNDPYFYARPRGYQEAKMADTTPFKMGAIEYILTKMEEYNNE